jgi:sec-independent protein translocase protein TatC
MSAPDANNPETAPAASAGEVSYGQNTDSSLSSSEPYGYHSAEADNQAGHYSVPAEVPPPAAPPAEPPPPSSKDDDDDEEDDGMLRMSFLEHLEELRARLISALVGLLLAYGFSLIFARQLWAMVSGPAVSALKTLGADPQLAQLKPMDAFMVIYFKLPLLAAVFLASPWLLWQVWSFVSPGLYKKERRMAGPFVIVSSLLFISGGLFAYYVAFPLGLSFLLGIGFDYNVKPVVDIVEYFDIFVNVMLGIGVVFELPILVFFLTLLRIVTPGFLVANSRYAILAIVVVAAVITPTPDVVNMMIISVPMIFLFFIGVFAGWILVEIREGRGFPWRVLLLSLLGLLVLAGGIVGAMTWKFGWKLVSYWPFLIR